MEKGKRREVVVSALQFACTDDVSTNLATAERSYFLLIVLFPCFRFVESSVCSRYHYVLEVIEEFALDFDP